MDRRTFLQRMVAASVVAGAAPVVVSSIPRTRPMTATEVMIRLQDRHILAQRAMGELASENYFQKAIIDQVMEENQLVRLVKEASRYRYDQNVLNERWRKGRPA